MSRELKFRAWDGERMISCFPTMDEKWVIAGFMEQFMNIALPQGLQKSVLVSEVKAVMQFTGLKDKNEKELYGSDIIRDLVTGIIYEICFGFNKEHDYNGWFCKGLSTERTTTLNGDYGGGTNSQIEIIGNIYENSELITPSPATGGEGKSVVPNE